ncbi:YbaB/EbfC family DNA-binding protein [Mycobacterium sp.]|uniref:YbaB/EbfC family DNA-binding protein n=1 Tax=Mycobacterium sp. TaxID=1785 RepID=UPI0031D6564E
MADGFSPYAPEDDDPGDLAARDYFSADDDEESSGLDAFDAFVQPAEAGASPENLPVDEPTLERDEPASPVVTVTNPPGTVSVSAYLDGRIERVHLVGVTKATESALADEILVIADLARQKARSAQHVTMLEQMGALGHDNASTRDFLARELDLPSPEQVSAAIAETFAVRYAGQHD